MEDELEIWMQLKPGTAMRVRMTVVQEGFPSPGEQNRHRQPYLSEIISVGQRIHRASRY